MCYTDMVKLPKDNEKYKWTNHAKEKMIYYRISESLVKRVVRFPKRRQEGIASGTLAAMQPSGSSKNKHEVWVMYSELGQTPSPNHQSPTVSFQPKVRIISAWRYPGTSPIGKKIPIPEEILQELENVI